MAADRKALQAPLRLKDDDDPRPPRPTARGGTRKRISSLAPLILGGVAAMVAIGLAIAAGLLVSQEAFIPAVALLMLAGVHALLAVTAASLWKQVTFDGRRYLIAGLLAHEAIEPGDVCLVVEARGLFCNTVRLHFNRRTRFGHEVAFVAPASQGGSAAVAASLRAVRASEENSRRSDPRNRLAIPHKPATIDS